MYIESFFILQDINLSEFSFMMLDFTPCLDFPLFKTVKTLYVFLLIFVFNIAAIYQLEFYLEVKNVAEIQFFFFFSKWLTSCPPTSWVAF